MAQDTSKDLTGIDDYNLTSTQLANLEFKAKAKDSNGEFAFRIAQYYKFIKQNRSMEMQWLRVASDQGNPWAQYNIAYYIVYYKDFKNWPKAESLLDKANITANRHATSLDNQELIMLISLMRAQMKKEHPDLNKK